MKFTLALLLFLFVNPSFARVEFKSNQQIQLTGPSCNELDHLAASILEWTKSQNGVSLKTPECYCSPQSCLMDVAPISPYAVKSLTNFQMEFSNNTAYNGPNCFNAALLLSSSLPHVVFTHPREMSAVLSSPLCVERTISEALQPGDLLVVRDQKNPHFEIHAGIYINEQLSFSKYGESKMMPYSYGLDVHKTYGVHNEKCKRVHGTPVRGDECFEQPFVNFFSCRPLHSFISQVVNEPGGLVEPVRQIYADTSTYDSRISAMAQNGRKTDTAELKAYMSTLAELYTRSQAIGADPTLNTDNRALLRLMRFHTYSLYEQLRIIAHERNEESLAGPALSTPQL